MLNTQLLEDIEQHYLADDQEFAIVPLKTNSYNDEMLLIYRTPAHTDSDLVLIEATKIANSDLENLRIEKTHDHFRLTNKKADYGSFTIKTLNKAHAYRLFNAILTYFLTLAEATNAAKAVEENRINRTIDRNYAPKMWFENAIMVSVFGLCLAGIWYLVTH